MQKRWSEFRKFPAMPDMGVTVRRRRDIDAYLYTLQ